MMAAPTEAPSPLVPTEVDLRDFAFMPLDVLRLRDSELASVENAEVFRCAVLTWCVSWHQVPAGSLPDDDALLARLVGFGRDVKGWKRIRAAGGMRGWLLCSDGRLYHEVVAEKARDAWEGKLAQRWRTEAARVKKHNQRHRLDGDAAVQMPEFAEWKASGCPQGQPLAVPGTLPIGPQGHTPPVPRETASKGQGEGQGDLVLLEGANAPSSSTEVDLAGPRPDPKTKTPEIPPPYDAIVDAYHEVLPELPAVRLREGSKSWPGRCKAMKSLWHWVLTSTLSSGQRRATNGDEALAWVKTYFRHARSNDWLMGRQPRSKGHENWKCTLDFLLTKEGMEAVIERTEVAA